MAKKSAISIVIPYRSGGDIHRERAFEFVHKHYCTLGDQGWQVVVADCPTKEWRKGAAVNVGVNEASGSILVLADADSYIALEGIVDAVERAIDGRHWIVPHGHVYRLTEAATAKVYDGGPPRSTDVTRYVYTGPPGGGINVMSRHSFEAVNGLDDRFVGWGGEDICFGLALSTMGYRHLRLNNKLWHLWHPHPAPDLRGSAESERLVARYRAADRNLVAMKELLFQR